MSLREDGTLRSRRFVAGISFQNPFDDLASNLGTKLSITFGILIFANVGGWVWALIAFHDQPVLLGTSFLAYTFGLRHAVDADHITAIDNVVRKLMHEDKSPYSVGFFFSLGHSSVVVAASIAIAGSAMLMQSRLDAFQGAGATLGTAVSALFLLIIAAANLYISKGIWETFSRARRGEPIFTSDFDALMSKRGLLARLFNPLFARVSRSWHMYPIGFLFGLGFDTATEIGLLGISAAQATQGMSFCTILIFPVLFTAGMSLVDTTDSALMTRVYGWTFVDPVRKLWYNLTITAASGVIALFIGGVEALALIGERFDMAGAIWSGAASLKGNIENFGFAIVAIYLVTWLAFSIAFRSRPAG